MNVSARLGILRHMATKSEHLDVQRLATEVREARLPAASVRQRIRTRAGVSLREAAAALGVSPMTVLRWEQGVQPSREHAIAYRRLLDALEEAAS